MDSQSILTTTALVIGVAGLLLAFLAHRRISLARRSLALLQGTFEGKTLVDAVASYIREVRTIEDDLLELDKRQQELFGLLGRSARNLGVVRFDAFEDMGGKLSFSAALVDDHGTGVVITSINGRTESRAYAKPIQAGFSEHNLSPEEQRAIADALGQRPKVRR